MCHQIPSNAKILVLLTVLCNSNPQTIPAATDNCYERIQGKRPIGRRRIGVLDSVKNGKDYANFKRCAIDRRV